MEGGGREEGRKEKEEGGRIEEEGGRIEEGAGIVKEIEEVDKAAGSDDGGGMWKAGSNVGGWWCWVTGVAGGVGKGEANGRVGVEGRVVIVFIWACDEARFFFDQD